MAAFYFGSDNASDWEAECGVNGDGCAKCGGKCAAGACGVFDDAPDPLVWKDRFQVGQRVRYAGDWAGMTVGMTGTVVDPRREVYMVGYKAAAKVEWDQMPEWTLVWDCTVVPQVDLEAVGEAPAPEPCELCQDQYQADCPACIAQDYAEDLGPAPSIQDRDPGDETQPLRNPNVVQTGEMAGWCELCQFWAEDGHTCPPDVPSMATLGGTFQMARAGGQGGGISLGELATISGVPKMTIRRIELGQTQNPSFRDVVRLARACGLKLDDLAALV